MLKKKLSQASGNNNNDSPPKKPKPNDDTTSKYFPGDSSSSFEQLFLNIQLELNSKLKEIKFEDPVKYVYNPLEYAFKANEIYVRKYCKNPKKLLFLGMNPGPFGMCQTGVPFGDVKSVRDWLEISVEISKPEIECPERPILGFNTKRSEVSGDRLWKLLKKLCDTPENFFRYSFIYNYCPLAMMKTGGGNITPSEIKNRKRLEEICDESFYKVIELLQPEIIIGIGVYAEKRAISVLKGKNKAIKTLFLPHPSPRATNNQNWLSKESEQSFMAEAFQHAREALAALEVPVGCIFVHDSRIVAVGRNTVNETRNATRHAEINCIEQVTDYCKANNLNQQTVFSETIVYVTVEPCVMCMSALFDLNVKNIVFGCNNDRFGGQTVFDVAKVHPVKVTVVKGGHRAEEAMDLLKEFYKGVNPSAPPAKAKTRGKKPL